MSQPIARASGPRNGFSLLEVMAGLSLVGLVLAGIWALLDSATDGRTRIIQEAERIDQRFNGERLLASFMANADVQTDSANRFVGDELHASFNTWCTVPQGWLERCRVELRLIDAAVGRDVALVANDEPRILRHFDARVELRYLGLTDSSVHWIKQWGTSIALPNAIVLVGNGDTTVLGGRGRQ